MNNIMLLAFFTVTFCMLPSCMTLTSRCETLNKTSGEIYDSKSTSNRDYSTFTKCWTISVPQDSYIRIFLKELKFSTSSTTCSEMHLKLHVSGTNETYTYCSQNQVQTPLTILSDVNITYYHKGDYTYRSSSFKLNFTTENLICAHANHFRCSNSGSCIHQYQVCDGIKDCENGADELGCDKGIKGIRGMNTSRDNAIKWLKEQRSASFGWGKNTHRAITALYLAEAANFSGQDLDEELMVKQLELQTSVALLRNSSDAMTVSELSMFINALTVTCHNPRQFFGHDLLKILGERVSSSHSPSPNAYLTLCNSNWTITEWHVTHLLKTLQKHSKYPFILDVQAVTMMALTCMRNKTNFRNIASAESIYEGTIQKFIASQHPDGSFGNIYTTALVTQALISSGQENNKQWNLTTTARYLMQQLNSSSMDFLSTYLVLPIFKSRSLVDIANVDCSSTTRKQDEDNEISDVTNKLGGKIQIQYSLFVGDQKDVIHTIYLKMPENCTVYDVMRVAQVADSKYKFQQRDVSGQMYVYEIADIINDPEAGKFWLLYTGSDKNTTTLKHHITSPNEFVLKDTEHLIMWYKTVDL